MVNEVQRIGWIIWCCFGLHHRWYGRGVAASPSGCGMTRWSVCCALRLRDTQCLILFYSGMSLGAGETVEEVNSDMYIDCQCTCTMHPYSISVRFLYVRTNRNLRKDAVLCIIVFNNICTKTTENEIIP
jgi:hypothetical protein